MWTHDYTCSTCRLLIPHVVVYVCCYVSKISRTPEMIPKQRTFPEWYYDRYKHSTKKKQELASIELRSKFLFNCYLITCIYI